MQRMIEVVVSLTGETTVQTRGYAGTDCIQASRFLEEALGLKTNEKLTSEFYASLTQSVEAQQSSE